ncbi:MAG: FlgD immunoglobulin-like domain containing protein [Candidatus Cloacimonetes bacterium]|nr:FlgD immunoglobulin-like domain containing protein [Candidatus Cloacimonadota bacterium]
MKNLFTLFVILFVVSNAYSVKLLTSASLKTVEQRKVIPKLIMNRNVPEWDWSTLPYPFKTDFYNFFPGSYRGSNVRLQTEENGNGMFMAFQTKENIDSIRTAYYSYVDENGEIMTWDMNPNLNITEGFPSIDIDLDTGYPFLAWHAAINGNPNQDFALTVDCYYDQIIDPPFPTEPIVWENNMNDKFIWPMVLIGPAPSYAEDGKRRAYIVAFNANTNYYGSLSENVKFGYCDFINPEDVLNSSEWTMSTIPQLDEWRNSNIRPFYTITCSNDGKIAFIGHTENMSENAGAYDNMDRLFVIENRNFGEGEWYTHLFDGTLPVDLPGGDYEDTRFSPFSSNHNNAFYDAQGNLQTTLLYMLQTETNINYTVFTVLKQIKYIPADNPEDEGEWEISCLYPRDTIPDDGLPYLPWSTIPARTSWPVWWYEDDDIYQEQYSRLSRNGNWIVAGFSDATKARDYHVFEDENYSDWANAPELYFVISSDYGETWSDPIAINPLDTPDLLGMAPYYLYLSDYIEIIDEAHGKIHMMFSLNDSYIPGLTSDLDGSSLVYASMIIEFDTQNDYSESFGYQLTDASELTIPTPEIYLTSYPNPFRPSNSNRSSATTIQFSVEQQGNVKVTVHNIKGQLVKTLTDGFMPAGEKHSVEWNGTDEAGNTVSSGVYLYKVETVQSVRMNKMLLLK